MFRGSGGLLVVGEASCNWTYQPLYKPPPPSPKTPTTTRLPSLALPRAQNHFGVAGIPKNQTTNTCCRSLKSVGLRLCRKEKFSTLPRLK